MILRRSKGWRRPSRFTTVGSVCSLSLGSLMRETRRALPLLIQLYHHQGQEAFHYRHSWQPGMLLMWDNRSVLHAATGGYDGHHRLLHRTTIAAP